MVNDPSVSDDRRIPPAERRVIRAPRPRRGLSFGSNTLSDSTSGAQGVEDEDDSFDEGASINDEIRRMAVSPARALPPPQDGAATTGDMPSQERLTPRLALQRVAMRSTAEAHEYRLDLVRRMLLTRQFTALEIADQLGVSVSTIHRDKKVLMSRFRKEAQGLDINELIGESSAFYREARAIAMRAASADNVPVPIKLAAVRTGLAATNDMHRYLETAGVYDVLRYRAAETGGGATDLERMLDATERILSGGNSGEYSTEVNSGDDEEIDL